MIREDKNQLKVAQEIVDAFEDGCKCVVLNAPTGSGKSGIAWFASKLYNKSACVLSHQKVLQDQYHELLGDKCPFEFSTLKGKENYSCLIRKNTKVSQGPCSLSSYACAHKANATCPYYKAKANAMASMFMNSNYQLVWNYSVLTNNFPFHKDLYICDEAHNILNMYISFRAPKITQLDLKIANNLYEFAKEDTRAREIKDIADSMSLFLKNMMLFEKDNEIKDAFKKYEKLVTSCTNELNSFMTSHQGDLYETGKINTFVSFVTYLNRFSNNYNYLNESGYLEDDVVVESKKDNNTFAYSLIPFAIGDLFALDSQNMASKFLFMSATIIDHKNFLDNLGFGNSKFKYIELPSTFPIENRKVYVMPGISINYNLIKKNPDKLEPMLNMVSELVTSKAKDNENGIIFTSSYDLTKLVIKHLYNTLDLNSLTLLYNLSTEERMNILEDFKEKDSLPKVLVSCSFFEGVNLDNDVSRYQIIFKVPYKSLASNYNKAIMERNSKLYSSWALTDIIQSSGRSIRHKEDYAETFIFDGNATRLLRMNKNLIPKWWWDAVEFV